VDVLEAECLGWAGKRREYELMLLGVVSRRRTGRLVEGGLKVCDVCMWLGVGPMSASGLKVIRTTYNP